MPIEVVALTTPAFAWRGPFKEPTTRPFAPETESAVEEAYGKVLAEVEVAVKYGAVSDEYRVEFPAAKLPTPATESTVPGEVVPMPTLPALVMRSRSVTERLPSGTVLKAR